MPTDVIDNAFFRRVVSIGDQIDGVLAFNVESRPRVVQQHLAGGGRGLYRNREQAVSRDLSVFRVQHELILAWHTIRSLMHASHILEAWY
jgi:hypothetical protein